MSSARASSLADDRPRQLRDPRSPVLCTKAGHARTPHPARGRAGPAAAADDRWALVARLLHEDTIDFTDRVAALLLPLYCPSTASNRHGSPR